MALRGTMLTFEPPGLEAELRHAFGKLSKSFPEADEQYGICEANYDPLEYEDEVIGVDSTLTIGYDVTVTVSDVLSWAAMLDTAILVDASEVRCTDSTYFRLEPRNDIAFGLLHALEDGYASMPPYPAIEDSEVFAREYARRSRNIVDLHTSLSHTFVESGIEVTCSIRVGPTVLGLVADRELSFRKSASPFDSEELALEITHAPNSDPDAIRRAASGYLFELSASYEIALEMAPFHTDSDYYEAGHAMYEAGERWIETGAIRLRPPPNTEGAGELVQLYNRACRTHDDEFAVLNFVRVIEYVAATVERMALHRAVRQRLLTPDALRPSASFIDGLVRAVDENNRSFRKDADAIRMAIDECCTIDTLASMAPGFLPDIGRLSQASSIEARQAALRRVADALVATRNEIAHAKPTYRRTGLECPPNHLPAFRRLASALAVQTIRWFCELPPHQRVTDEG